MWHLTKVADPALRQLLTFVNLYHRDPLCPVSPPLLSNLENSLDPPKDLQKCYNENCAGKAAGESCYGLRSCTWCVYNKETSASLKTPYCTNSEKCYGGVQGLNSFSRL